MTFENARKTKKEIAERPFSTYDMNNGKELTIEENLPLTAEPRTVELKAKESGKPYRVAALKASNGIFEKDLHLFDREWNNLCTAMPDALINFQGVTISYDYRIGEFKYIGVRPHNQQGQDYKNGNENVNDSESVKPIPREDQRDNQVNTLTIAMKSTQMLGIALDTKTMIKISEGISPGNALNLINHAKVTGKIMEKDGVYTVV